MEPGDAPPTSSTGILPIPDYNLDFSQSRYLSRDWGGRRTDLAELGIQADIWWTQVAQGVVSGGRDQEWAYGGKLDTQLQFDLDRMGIVPGGLVLFHGESRYGESVNDAAGTLLAVNDVLFFPLTDEPDENIPFNITELRYTQFLSKELGFFVGKFVPLGGDVNEFAGGRGDTQFMSHPFDSASVTAVANPYSTLGGGVFYVPTEGLTLQANIYQSTDSSTTTGFDNFDKGWTTDLSLRYQYRRGNLPGGFRVAFEYAFDGDFANFGDRFVDADGGPSIPRSDSTWLSYANLWQYVYVEEPADRPINVGDGRQDLQGIGLFVRGGFADQDVNPVEWVLSAGIGGKGVIPGRVYNTFGIGYAYAKIRENTFATGTFIEANANRFESYYNVSITPAAELTFNIQYTDSLLERNDPATLLGVRLRLSF